MTDWQNVPTFGEHVAGETLVIRPSAYGLIVDDHGRVAVVHTPNGIYLPGGGSAESEVAKEQSLAKLRRNVAWSSTSALGAARPSSAFFR